MSFKDSPCHHGHHYPPPHDHDHHLTPQVLGKGGPGHHDGLACHSQQGDRCHESSNCGQLATFVVFAILLFFKSDKRMNKSLLPFQLNDPSTLFLGHKGHVPKNSFQVLFRLCQRQDILSKEGGRTGLKYFSIVSSLTIIITIIKIGVVINIL